MCEKYYDKNYTAICSEKTLQSNEKGFFMQFVENVVNIAGEEWIQKKFGQLKSDKERIRIIYEYEPVQTAVYNTLSHVQEIYRKKSAEVSQARRQNAKKHFENADIQKSLILYSQSVLRAPTEGHDTENCLNLALWGRAQVLMAMQEYNLALLDIQSSLKQGLGESYKAEAFWKMGICYKGIDELNRATVSFAVAEKLLQRDEGRLKLLRADITKDYKEVKKGYERAFLIKDNSENSKDDDEQLNSVMPFVTGKRHPDFPNASNKICIKEDKNVGRYGVAKETIRTGETLIVEPPYAACLLPECFGTHCHHCFERLISPIGCLVCSSIAFCKAECRDTAISTYHQYECKYLDLLIGSGMSILAHTCLRMITQNTLKYNLEIYDNRKLEKAFSLCTNAEVRLPEDFFQRTLMAAFLLRCLQRSGYFPNREKDDYIPTEDEFKIGELFLFNLQMLQFNAHEIYETRRTSDHRYKNAKAAYIGVAIYPTVALLNHDCYHAATRYFVGKNIVVNAVRPIKPGEMISENYGPVFTRRKLADRQKSLLARYWFTCQCIACSQDWPSIDTGLEKVSRKIRCPTDKCINYFALPLSKEIVNCQRCKKKVALADNIMKLQICEEQLRETFELMQKEESKKGLLLLLKAIETFHKISVPPHCDVHLGQELLRTFLADNGNVYVSMK